MELRQLRALEAVMETGSFSAAARMRHVAQPALWQQVKALERELGIALFERVGRGVRPTRAAIHLRQRVQLVIDDARALETIAGELRQGHEAPARIGCAHYHVSHFLVRCFARLLRADPSAPRPAIVPVTTATSRELLERGDVDLIATPEERPPAPAERLYPVWLSVIGRGLRARTVDVRALDKRHIATLPTDARFRMMLDEACTKAGVRPIVAYEAREAVSLLAWAKYGLAYAVLASEALSRAEAQKAARLCLGGRPLQQDLWLQWRNESALPEAARMLRDVMVAEAKRMRR
jgi:DNA-binding transcriptional LysR family regulator